MSCNLSSQSFQISSTHCNNSQLQYPMVKNETNTIQLNTVKVCFALCTRSCNFKHFFDKK